MDSIAKILSDEIHATQVAFVRFAIQIILLSVFISFTKTKATLKSKNPAASALLGIILALALVAYFTSLKWLPLANATAIFFVEPLFVTVLSHVFLGEKVGWRRYLAVLVGLVGALIIIRPSFVEIGWPSLLPALSALLAAMYMILGSKLARNDHPLSMQISAGIGGFLFLGVLIIIGTNAGYQDLTFVWPDQKQSGLLLLAGFVGTAVAVLLIYAVKFARTSFLGPFGYFEIVTAIFLSAMLFNEIPDAYTWLGIIIIISSGLFILWRENAAKQ